MTYQEIIKDVSTKLDIPEKVVNAAYRSFWVFVKKSIKDLPLKGKELSEEEYKNLRTSFNIPSLGKLVCTYDRYKMLKERFKHLDSQEDDNNKEDKTDV